MKYLFKLFTSLIFLVLIFNSLAQVQPKEEWWLEEPYRLIQTNLREIDAIDFDVDIYIKSLKDIGANTVLINVGGIVANYYTDMEFQYQNPNLKFDLINEVIGRLHNEGIRVMGRFDFSKLNEQLAAKKPEWLYKNLKGENVNYNGQVHTCVNGGYQQEYSLKILNEVLTKFPLDGVFFNMIGYQTRDYSHNYHGICQADACRERFKEWSGGLDLPTKEDNNDPVFRQYQKFKSETSNELFARIHDLIKSFGNQIAICTYTHAGTDFFRKESNSHAALYDDFVPWEYQSVHNVKSAIGSWKNKQVSNAAVHFYGYPARHSADARWLTEQRLVENMINGAGVDFYCIGRLDNLEDRTVLENIKTVFQFHKKNEKYLHHTITGNKVLLLHDGQSGKEYNGLFEVLTENHIQFDVMEHWCINTRDVPREIESYELIVMPDISRLSDEEVARLDKYVEKGGKLLVTGFTSTKDAIGNPLDKIRLKSLGVKSDYKIFEKKQGTYYRVFEKDKKLLGDRVFAGFDIIYAWEQGMLCEPKPGVTGLLGFIPPAMIGPPEKTYYTEVTEIPGLIANDFGKGETAFFPFKIGALYHHKRHYGHSALVISALRSLLDFEQDIKTEVSPLVEIARQKSKDGDFEWYGLLNHSGQLGNGFNTPLPMQDISFSFKPDKPVKSVKSLQTGEKLSFKSSGETVKVTLPKLNSFDVVLVEY
ncbi:beta-galactosidase trimerization domain-containing protein [Draconibacterium sp.]|nr:beta-galactosidase trimerization domain-containing protein [Draconibacterium sp.]